MKESIHTIPLMDAFKAEDECPFCYLGGKQSSMRFRLRSVPAHPIWRMMCVRKQTRWDSAATTIK